MGRRHLRRYSSFYGRTIRRTSAIGRDERVSYHRPEISLVGNPVKVTTALAARGIDYALREV